MPKRRQFGKACFANFQPSLVSTPRQSDGSTVASQYGKPGISLRCARLAECLPSLQHDPNRPEDVLKVDADEDGVGGDDAADALRYLVATKARSISVRKLRWL